MKKIGRWILLFLIVFFVWNFFLKWIYLNQTITIQDWENVSKIFNNLWTVDKLRIKIYIYEKKKSIDFSKLSAWTYVFSWYYSKSDFINKILIWPKQTFTRYTVLEWRSIYDIDSDLSKKWFIKQWEFISFVTDANIIWKYILKYEFLQKTNKNLISLEWFLYPDTYYVPIEKNFVDQLVYMQLENFKNKVWENVKDKLNWFILNRNDILILASIVEKEEKKSDNKPIVAWIFIKRLNIGMKLDADVSLCYWLHQSYETCKNYMTTKNLNDKNNIFNTRQNKWLTPQAISNPSISSITSVLNYTNTDYLFYLHDKNWQIHYWKTLEEHNQNKQIYLN
jgi:UPF0755 protein